MLYSRIATGFILGTLGYLVINDTHRVMKLNKIEILLTMLLSDIAHLKEELVDKKEFTDCMERLEDEETVNKETGEVNPNLIYDDDVITDNETNKVDDSSSDEEKAGEENVKVDDSSSDEWREVEEK